MYENNINEKKRRERFIIVFVFSFVKKNTQSFIGMGVDSSTENKRNFVLLLTCFN